MTSNNIIINDMIKPVYKDEDLIRIKSKIELLNKTLNHGIISTMINLFISWMVTLEVSNGVEKITVQNVLVEIKNRINELNKMFDEMSFGMEFIDDLEKRNNEKQKFRVKVYKLFDLGDLVQTVIRKCVTFSGSVNRLIPLITNYLNPYTIIMIDSLLLTDTDVEFEKKIYEYIIERCVSIEDPIKRKMEKIKILNNVLKQVMDEPIDMNYYVKNQIKLDEIPDKNKLKEFDMLGFIELTDIIHTKH